jgi:hypothetical protein
LVSGLGPDVSADQLPPRGVEQAVNSSKKTRYSQCRGAKSGALGPKETPIDLGLKTVVEAWPTLPEAIKAGMLAMIKAAAGRAAESLLVDYCIPGLGSSSPQACARRRP